jgi:hypothetical protein
MMGRYDLAGVAAARGGLGTVASAGAPAASKIAESSVAASAKEIAPRVRAERRKATRPWSNRTSNSQSAAAPRPEAAAASPTRVAAQADPGKDGNEWQEF